MHARGPSRVAGAGAILFLPRPPVASLAARSNCGLIGGGGILSEPSVPKLSRQPDAETYRVLVDHIQDYAILMLDADGYLISWNEGAEKIQGYTADEILGSHFSCFYPPEAIERDLPRKALSQAAAVGHFEDEGWRLRKDGSAFWANVVITRMLGGEGRLMGFSTITRDSTERRRQESLLKRSEERFRLLIAGVKDYAIFMLNPQGIVETWNAGAAQIKGYSANEIIGCHFSVFYPPDAIKRGLPDTELRGAMMQGRFEDEGWRLRKDGSRFWANVIITAVRNASGHLIGFSKITRDLTERRRHEDELRKSEERFRLLVDGVTEYAIMTLDSEGFVTSWNAGAERIKGYKSPEILGKHVSHFYPSEAVLSNKPWEDLRIAREHGRVTDEGWRLRKDGTLFWASTVITSLHDQTGRPHGFAMVTQDLTQRRNAEALADTTQRMHEFIAMLAHELRNPLAPIRNAVALMGRKGLKDPTLESMRQTIDRQSMLLTRLLDELLDVNRIARGQFVIERELVDVRDVLTRAIETSRPLIDSRRHSLEVSVPDQPARVLGDALRLTQTFVNLLNNAAKYTPEGGSIRLSAAVRGAEIEVRVIDNGAGIERDMLEKVFDLFVQVDSTMQHALGGLGVGLALVRRVVELHGGNVLARSEGKTYGAEFVVRLPLSIEQIQVISTRESPVPGSIRALRVLIVDDNRDAADSLNLLLASMGQCVYVAYDGQSAISAAKAFKPEIVLLDIGMPQMSGYDVARALRADASASKSALVAVTGWGQEADKERAKDAGFTYHFVKPISEDALRMILTEVSAAENQ
jgi:PAS domain S-box-containing protein